MKVHEVIEELREFDQIADVLVFDEYLGTYFRIKYIEKQNADSRPLIICQNVEAE